MRVFRNVTFVLLLMTAVAPVVLSADGSEFCSAYQAGCGCDIFDLGFSSECTGYENCSETLTSYCEDAWYQCYDHCWDLHSGDMESHQPRSFSCTEDYDCSMYCECWPLE